MSAAKVDPLVQNAFASSYVGLATPAVALAFVATLIICFYQGFTARQRVQYGVLSGIGFAAALLILIAQGIQLSGAEAETPKSSGWNPFVFQTHN